MTNFQSTVHLCRRVWVDRSDTLPGKSSLLRIKTKIAIPNQNKNLYPDKKNQNLLFQAKKSLNKMRLYFTHTNMIFSMGVDGKDKVSKSLEIKIKKSVNFFSKIQFCQEILCTLFHLSWN